MNFSMMQYHKYSLTELEEMLPFEREIYIQMLIEYIGGFLIQQDMLQIMLKII